LTVRPEIDLRRFATRAELDAALAARIVHACGQAVSRTRAGVMLSGGDTPQPAYALAASWRPRAHDELGILYSDDRHVPIDSDASNYRSTKALIEAMAVPEVRVLRVRTELPLDAAAADYDARLASWYAEGFGIGFGLFGIGEDGHTASLFTSADIARAQGRLAIGVRRPDGMDGITVTPAVIARVAEPLLAATGRAKRRVLAAFVRGERDLIASQAFSGCTRVEVWTDPEAYPQERVQL
jgi:6-phosphogluconolactonase